MEKFSDLPGHTDLTTYKNEAHRGGIALFRAYVNHRAANQDNYTQRKTALIKNAECGLSPQEFERNSTEILLLNILEELDPVISDLLRFCETPNDPDYPVDQLPELRSALRIGKFNAPTDSRSIEKKWEIQQRWIAAYLEMQDSRVHQSRNKIADSIGASTGVSRSTAINYWNEFIDRLPHQARWAEQIEKMASPSKSPVLKSTRNSKSKKKQKTRLTFGKKRTD